jgi:hypothetical protein
MLRLSSHLINFKLFINDKSSKLLGCQAELVEADVLLQTRLLQAQADNFYN